MLDKITAEIGWICSRDMAYRAKICDKAMVDLWRIYGRYMAVIWEWVDTQQIVSKYKQING